MPALYIMMDEYNVTFTVKSKTIMANEYGINHIERCFDSFVVSEVEKEIQYHKGRIKYWAERLEKLEQQLKNNKLEGACHEEQNEDE
jgi:hypothetical protein